ncbi:MAG: YicC/YloC family endoribonuclease [Planctomycetaceae bacterium]
MLLSMTGFGESRHDDDRLSISVDVRSVNNKHLKVSVRCSEAYLTLENDIERLVRARLARGTVYVNLRAIRLGWQQSLNIDSHVLAHYWKQLTETSAELGVQPPHDISSLLMLPGVSTQAEGNILDVENWPLIETAVEDALARLQEFRLHEGTAMQRTLEAECDAVESHLNVIAERAPLIVSESRDKLLERVQTLLKDSGVSVEPNDLIREVSILSDRCDVSEEITRLRCHIDQFRQQFQVSTSPGRKLDFLCQEMFRECNTIGSKANNIDISHRVVDAKTAIEKMREIVQNIE